MTPETQPGQVLSRQERAREADQLILIFEETIAKMSGVQSATRQGRIRLLRGETIYSVKFHLHGRTPNFSISRSLKTEETAEEESCQVITHCDRYKTLVDGRISHQITLGDSPCKREENNQAAIQKAENLISQL